LSRNEGISFEVPAEGEGEEAEDGAGTEAGEAAGEGEGEGEGEAAGAGAGTVAGGNEATGTRGAAGGWQRDKISI